VGTAGVPPLDLDLVVLQVAVVDLREQRRADDPTLAHDLAGIDL